MRWAFALIATLLLLASAAPIDPPELTADVDEHLNATQQICAICFDHTTKPFHYFQCTHTNFHSQCVYRYEKIRFRQITCPLCRSPQLPFLTSTELVLADAYILHNSIPALHSLSTLLTTHTLADTQTIQLIGLSIQTPAFPKIINNLSLRTWLSVRLLLFNTFLMIHDAPSATSDATQIAIMQLSELSHAHVDMHSCCILRGLWRCSDVFLEFYAGQTVIIDITSTFAKAVLMEASERTVERFLALPDRFLPLSTLFTVMRVAVDMAHWQAVELLLRHVKGKNENVVEVMQFLMIRVPDMPHSLVRSVLQFNRTSQASYGYARTDELLDQRLDRLS